MNLHNINLTKITLNSAKSKIPEIWNLTTIRQFRIQAEDWAVFCHTHTAAFLGIYFSGPRRNRCLYSAAASAGLRVIFQFVSFSSINKFAGQASSTKFLLQKPRKFRSLFCRYLAKLQLQLFLCTFRVIVSQLFFQLAESWRHPVFRPGMDVEIRSFQVGNYFCVLDFLLLIKTGFG